MIGENRHAVIGKVCCPQRTMPFCFFVVVQLFSSPLALASGELESKRLPSVNTLGPKHCGLKFKRDPANIPLLVHLEISSLTFEAKF